MDIILDVLVKSKAPRLQVSLTLQLILMLFLIRINKTKLAALKTQLAKVCKRNQRPALSIV